MSYFLRLFCQSNQAITRREIVEFILDGIYFDPAPEFLPDVKGTELDTNTWGSLEVRYESEKRPIIISRTLDVEEIQTEVGEILEEIAPITAHPEIKRRLEYTIQVIAFEIDQVGLTEEAWDMLDHLEAYFAPRLDGMIYAPDDGFYDAKLHRLLKLN